MMESIKHVANLSFFKIINLIIANNIDPQQHYTKVATNRSDMNYDTCHSWGVYILNWWVISLLGFDRRLITSRCIYTQGPDHMIFGSDIIQEDVAGGFKSRLGQPTSPTLPCHTSRGTPRRGSLMLALQRWLRCMAMHILYTGQHITILDLRDRNYSECKDPPTNSRGDGCSAYRDLECHL